MKVIKPVTTILNENYKKQLAISEYQLILSPHEELCNKIRQIKNSFQEDYQAASVPGGKPRLTLVRFTQLTMMEERIVQRLRTIAMGFCPFKVELKDFGSLPTHSIFINVTSKLPIRGLVKEIRETQRLMKLDKDHKPHFIDEPNLLIARQLQPWQFEKGWLEYSNKSFTGRFVADAMLLLRRSAADVFSGSSRGSRNAATPANWQIAERFDFRNLPVSTRQGDLFTSQN
ncbi:MAG TPA: 2'-5' RNA ligase family protein [Puia sp.]|jgi:2'-5' RNA ligase|nr:2'-5' RNA ligase family protein [Puia sp.]